MADLQAIYLLVAGDSDGGITVFAAFREEGQARRAAGGMGTNYEYDVDTVPLWNSASEFLWAHTHPDAATEAAPDKDAEG